MLGIGTLPALISTLGIASLPHSPRWILCNSNSLTLTERRSEALDALKLLRPRLRSPPGASLIESCCLHDEWERQIQVELEGMCSSTTTVHVDESEGPVSVVHKFLNLPGTWKTFWVMFFSQCNGCVAIFYYKANVLTAIGLGSHAGSLTAFMMAVRSIAIPWGAMMAGSLGYRDSLILGSLGASVSMVGMSLCQSSGVASLVFLVANTTAFQLSFGTIGHQVAAELFPQQHRQRGIAWAHICNAPLKALSLQLFPVVLSHAGPGPVWIVYAAVNAAGILMMYKMLPEMQGKSLEDIERELQSKT